MSSSTDFDSSDTDNSDENYSFYNQPMISEKHGKRFTKEEDNLLKELAKDKKNKTWKEIASYLPGRTACQCRDRYNQYLFKEVVSKPWSSEEDDIIVEKYRQYGPHWVKISQFLPGRSGNNVKNRWNSALTKYHGITHKNVKQERRSKRDKWNEELKENDNNDNSKEDDAIEFESSTDYLNTIMTLFQKTNEGHTSMLHDLENIVGFQ